MVRKHKSLFILLVLLPFPFLAVSKVASQNIARDVSLYDNLGPYYLSVGQSLSTKDRDSMRDFVWEHWQEKRLGLIEIKYMRVIKVGDEEGPPTKRIYIEPDGTAQWWVIIEVERDIFGKGPEVIRASFDIIERIELTRNGLPTHKVLPGEDRRLLEEYELRLKDSRTGKEAFW